MSPFFESRTCLASQGCHEHLPVRPAAELYCFPCHLAGDHPFGSFAFVVVEDESG